MLFRSVPLEPADAATFDEPANEPPCTSEPRTERMMRRVIVVVSTAAMEVTIVLIVSFSSVGDAMNQKSMFTMFTIQIAP